jgi:hypothetical protein
MKLTEYDIYGKTLGVCFWTALVSLIAFQWLRPEQRLVASGLSVVVAGVAAVLYLGTRWKKERQPHAS